MNKEDVTVLAQLQISLKEAARKLSLAYDKRDAEGLADAKREILKLQKEIDKIL